MQPCSLARGRDVLAGESPAHHVDCGWLDDGPDISEVGDARPAQREHVGGVGVDLGVPDRACPGDGLDGEVETTDAREERADGEPGTACW